MDGQLCFRRQVEVIAIAFREAGDSIKLLLTVTKQSFGSGQGITALVVGAKESGLSFLLSLLLDILI